jgi:hypothetical protein
MRTINRSAAGSPWIVTIGGKSKHVATIFALGFAAVAMSACNTVQEVAVQSAVGKQVGQYAVTNKSKTVEVSNVVVKFDSGHRMGIVRTGIFCIARRNPVWRSGGLSDASKRRYTHTFHREAKAVGIRVIGDPDRLFKTGGPSSADLQVAAVFDDYKYDFCLQRYVAGEWQTKGKAFFEITWKVLSSKSNTVVAEITTQGSGVVKDAVPGGTRQALDAAFAMATRNLFANPRFRQLIY